MREHSFLRRFVVIRRDDQCAVRAEFAHFPRKFYRLRRVVTAAPAMTFAFNLCATSMVIRITCSFSSSTQSHGFARRAARNQKFHTVFDLPLNQTAKTFVVNRAVFSKRRNQSRSASAHPIQSHCHNCFPASSKNNAYCIANCKNVNL